jgi:hypothetical protein
MSRRVAKSAAGARKRLRKANDADEVVGFSLLDDEDATRQPASEEDEEQHETAEQKRIRLGNLVSRNTAFHMLLQCQQIFQSYQAGFCCFRSTSIP